MKKPRFGHFEWENYSHQSLWNMLLLADPREMMTRAADLDSLATSMGADADAVQSALQTLLSSWTGAAADQTAAVVKPVLAWAAHAANTSSQIAHRLGVYAEAVDHARKTMPKPVAEQSATTPEAAAAGHAHAAARKATAVDVMRTYEARAAAAYHRMPTFTKPPSMPGLTSTAPTAPPSPKVSPPPPATPQPTPVPTPPGGALGSGTGQAGMSGGTTTPSDFAGPAVPGAGGIAGGVIGGLPGVGATGGLGSSPGTVAGVPPMSGAGALAGDAALGRMAAAEAAAQGGWNGFAPMGQGGARSENDGEHRDRFACGSDLIGDLPPAFPPVLGL
jgi:hypothetical protein